MMRRTILTATAIGFLAILSCQDPMSLLPDVQVQKDSTAIRSIEEGSIIQPGMSIPLSLSYTSDEAVPDKMVISLYKDNGYSPGQAISEVILGPEDIAKDPLPPLALPLLERGTYRLHFVLYQGDKAIKEDSVVFFYETQGFEIQNVLAYPSTVTPGSDGLLKVFVQTAAKAEYALLPDADTSRALASPDISPPGLAANDSDQTEAISGDYYIRWSTNGRTIGTGLYRENGGSLNIAAPDKEGIYTYLVEVFPSAPVDGEYRFSSPIKRQVRLVVAQTEQASAGDLGPEADFSSLYHFRGNVNDSGWDTGKPDAPWIFQGKRVFDLKGESLGYLMGQGSVLTAGQTWLPDFSTPYHGYGIFMSIVSLESRDGSLLRMQSEDNRTSLVVSAVADGRIRVKITGSGLLFDKLSETPFLSPGVTTQLQLFLFGDGDKVEVELLSGNGPVLKETVTLDVHALYEANSFPERKWQVGTTEIGNLGGPSFLLDEFGIYDPENAGDTATSGFSVAMKYKYGEALRLAHDFGGGNLPQGFEAEGNIGFSDTRLLIAPGATLKLPLLAFESRALKFEILFDPAGDVSQGSVLVQPIVSPDTVPSGDHMIRIGLDGTIGIGERVLETRSNVTNPLVFAIVPSDKEFSLNLSGNGTKLPWDPLSQLVSISVSQDSGALVALELERMLVVAERTSGSWIQE